MTCVRLNLITYPHSLSITQRNMLHLSSKLGSYYRSHRLDTFTFAPPKRPSCLPSSAHSSHSLFDTLIKTNAKLFPSDDLPETLLMFPKNPKKKKMKKRQSAHFAATSFWCQLLANLSLRKSAVGCSRTKQHDKNEK